MTKSRNDRDLLRNLVSRDDFNKDDIKDTNFRKIEEELRGRLSCCGWEQQRGWRASEITIGIPLGIKKTASRRREDTAHTGGEGSFTQWVHCEFVVSFEAIRPVVTQQVCGEFF